MKNHLTIIIPTFNRYNKLLRLLQYYESHNFPAKIRVLDSSSEEPTSSVLQSLLQSKYVEYVKFPHIISVADKLSKGSENIFTPYSAFCADDDFMTPTGMAECVKFLESRSDYSSAQGRYVGFWIKDGKLSSVHPGYIHGRNIDINNSAAVKRFIHQFSLYKPQLYAVHRTGNLQAFSKIIQTGNLINAEIALLIELLVNYVALVFGKHKVLPIFYYAGESIIDEKSWPTFLPSVEIIASDSKYTDEYCRFIEALALLLSTIQKIDKYEARSQVLKGMDAYLNVFVPSFKKGAIKIMGPPECVKGEEGYPFFNNTSAIEEWRKIEFFLKQSLEMTNAYDLNQHGMLLMGRGDRVGALNSFLRAINLDPEFAMPYQNAGILFLQTGQANKAFQCLAKALEIAPDDRNIVLNTAKLLRTLKLQSS